MTVSRIFVPETGSTHPLDIANKLTTIVHGSIHSLRQPARKEEEAIEELLPAMGLKPFAFQISGIALQWTIWRTRMKRNAIAVCLSVN